MLRFRFPSIPHFIDQVTYLATLGHYSTDLKSYWDWLLKRRCCPVWGLWMKRHKALNGFRWSWEDTLGFLTAYAVYVKWPETPEDIILDDLLSGPTKPGGCCWQVRQNSWGQHFKEVCSILKERYV